ncbi:glutamine--fructose-6-phosphate transaminase (isomerizing) [Candidatus Marinimicrobia bacterium]|nr:glutamine--fructose-6-phosphate transaminase (isomerizing) [Candidatus Neomarinimicrobiota bacterium]|tara:strand:- start:21 stop:1865 length:1845 start_codon:yes stop_codon:yes gene_type:complete
MCGIVSYIGNKDPIPILIKGLRRLEYRGYDSAGLALLDGKILKSVKKAGKVSELSDQLSVSPLKGNCGIAHTRWATHGVPNDINAHPHLDKTGKIALVHNGIIENYDSIKKTLEKRGVAFSSDTDSEVLVQLISEIYHNDEDQLDFKDAVKAALQEVVGAYGIVAMCSDEPDSLFAARMGSPLVLGVGENEFLFASDASPIIEYTRNVIYLDDGEFVEVKSSAYSISNIYTEEIVSKTIIKIDLTIEEIEKGEFPHFMLKEIHDQKHSISDTLRGRLNLEDGTSMLGGINDYLPNILGASRIYITACGTSWHAGLIGKHLIEEYARVPVHVEYASEFRYRNAIIDANTILIAISQSGETADTLAAIKKSKELGALTLGICNVVGSSISRETDAGIFTHAGPEIGVASTKAFTAQVTVLIMLALKIGRKKGVSLHRGKELISSLKNIDINVSKTLETIKLVRQVAKATRKADNYLYLGRGVNFPVALEGALKLKEISYIHAEGYPAAEMKHGPIALIDKDMPVVFLAPQDDTFLKILSNIEEVKARGGIIITVTDEENDSLNSLSDYVLITPKSHRYIFPITSSIILQMLAYELAQFRGCEIDQPRNLAKSVTVE